MENKGLLNVIIGFLVLGLALVLLLTVLPDKEDQNQNQQPLPNNGDQQEQMITYQNEEFGFSFEYPESWQVEEQTDLNEPVITVYKPETVTGQESEGIISHHTNATQVTIAPRGIGTEGRTSESEEVELDLTEEVEAMVRQFIFSDTGEPFAYFITFEDAPQSWNESGFVWAAAEIHNERTECADQDKTLEECDSLMDGTLIFGNVESSEWQQVQDILATFEFTE